MAQAKQSSLFSRKLVNLFIGMAYGSPDLPRVLADDQYVCHAIESDFATGVGKIVNPELILCSDQTQHTLILEAKSGANLKVNQLERYSLITSASLVNGAFASQASATTHDVLFIGLEEMKDRLQIGSLLHPSRRRILAVAKGLQAHLSLYRDQLPLYPEPAIGDENAGLAALSKDGIERIENDFASASLNLAFGPLLEIDWELVPSTFLPVDHESEPWEFAQFLLPDIIAAILNGEAKLSIEALAKSFIRNWNFIATNYKKQLLDKIRNVLLQAAQKRFAVFIDYGTKGKSKDEIRLIVPEKLVEANTQIRTQLYGCLRDLMMDLDAPQSAIIYED